MAKDWFPSWFKDKEDAEDKDKDKNKKDALPPELEERFNKMAGKEDILKINERLASLDSITAFIEDQKKEKEEARLATEKKKKPAEQKTPEDIAAELLTDPQKVISESTEPLARAILQVRADTVRRQVFEDDASKFEYYSGDIKKEVDSVIAAQKLEFQNDPKSLENAYNTVVGRHMPEILEGKIKSRFASSSGTSLNKAPNKEEDFDFELTPDMLRAAKLTGMDPKDYKELVKRAAKSGDLEYV